jgi:hypothetical protein
MHLKILKHISQKDPFLKFHHLQYIRRGGFIEEILIGKVLDQQNLILLQEEGENLIEGTQSQVKPL